MKEIIYEVKGLVKSKEVASKSDIEELTMEIEKLKYEIQMKRFKNTCKSFKKDSEKFMKLMDEI